MNVDLLAKLRLQGVYLVPGVPNTTGKTQETDQSYGPFKGHYRRNIRTLSQARFDRNLCLKVTDLPLLVFGGKCEKTGVLLDNSFALAFSVASNLNCWRKCGAVPLTRKPLELKDIRREIPIGPAAEIVSSVEEEEEVKRLRQLEDMNSLHVGILTSLGFDGSKLKKEAPKRSQFVAVTKPESKERVQALKKAKTAGQMFYATGGRHINADEFFVATELKQREEKIKKMEDAKAVCGAYCKEQRAAYMLIREKGELTFETEKKFTLSEVKILLKWKKVKAPSSKKKDMVETHVAAARPRKPQKTWTRSEEAALVELKKENLPMKDTAVGVAATQMAKAVTKNLSNLDSETIRSLQQALDAHSGNTPDAKEESNVI